MSEGIEQTRLSIDIHIHILHRKLSLANGALLRVCACVCLQGKPLSERPTSNTRGLTKVIRNLQTVPFMAIIKLLTHREGDETPG